MGAGLVGHVGPPAGAALLGYATRSRCSAWVMRAIDLIPACEGQDGPPDLRGKCVISSVAGVGDLFIHLPLIQGIVTRVLENGGTPLVALRPAHSEIGRACGWNVIEFENPLQDLFGGTVNPRVLRAVLRDTRRLRKLAPDLWLDLTGNAFNALNLRLGGVRTLGARVTRGGASFVRYRFPNRPFENEYGNRERLAEHLKCQLDHSIFERISTRAPQNHVLLGLTTNCRWRNWPIARFLEVVRRFPDRPFILAGLTREIVPESQSDLAELIRLPNVVNKLDRLTLLDLVHAVAGSAAVLTNDTGTAHIANAWNVPGAVLFGPGISEQWGCADRLQIFHDRSCPLYPCVAWRCGRPDEWCMKKIAVGPVIEHLTDILPPA